MNLEQTIEPEQVEPFVQRKAELQEEIESLQTEIETLKEARKATACTLSPRRRTPRLS
jgi:prefoldin subunit 5